ncbi:MAG: hypothetical protein HY887_05025 [Deltaproteobacteria bacterium]|nr:hypothetical protein [Deltaproteobacteria bacterium]
MDIVTFKCSECDAEFYGEEGGICAACNKAFCADHLYEVKGGSNPKMLCRQDKGALPGMRKEDSILRIRRLLGAKKK